MPRLKSLFLAFVGMLVMTASAGQTSATFTVSATVLPSKKQRAIDSTMVAKKADGSVHVLTPEQRIRYAEHPGLLLQELKEPRIGVSPDESGHIRINIDY